MTLTGHRTSGIGATALRASSQDALDWESQWYEAPEEPRPALKNQPQAFPGKGVGVRRLDHVSFLAAETAAAGAFVRDALGARVTEQIMLDSGRISAQWLHFANKSHDGVFIETGPRKHAIQQTFFLYVYEPGGNRIELCNPRTRLILAPDWQPITWTEAERARRGG